MTTRVTTAARLQRRKSATRSLHFPQRKRTHGGFKNLHRRAIPALFPSIVKSHPQSWYCHLLQIAHAGICSLSATCEHSLMSYMQLWDFAKWGELPSYPNAQPVPNTSIRPHTTCSLMVRGIYQPLAGLYQKGTTGNTNDLYFTHQGHILHVELSPSETRHYNINEV